MDNARVAAFKALLPAGSVVIDVDALVRLVRMIPPHDHDGQQAGVCRLCVAKQEAARALATWYPEEAS